MTNLAVSGLVANSLTTGVFGANLFDFFTGFQNGVYRPGQDTNQRITLPELLGAGPGGFGGNFHHTTSLGAELKKNITNNMGTIAMGVIGIPIIAKVATSVLRKPVLTPANKLLKMTGLDVKV